ncbi:MAG: 4'-phosphopantetheinyl transferase superfamily protein, partial [bacterium]|nr:4'-phosphopantetheinyl transferase superfamily protein [bacterium]
YLEPSIFRELFSYIDDLIKSQIDKIVDPRAAHQKLYAQLLIRWIIHHKTGLKYPAIHFTRNENGKPSLKDNPEFHFNLSHSGDWIVCAVDNSPVGIDIQEIFPISLEISKRHFTTEEHHDLMSKKEHERIPYFFTLWTLKESYLKALGKGMFLLKGFSVGVKENGKIGLQVKKELPERRFFTRYHIQPGYEMALCTTHKESPPRIIQTPAGTLIRDFLHQ